MAKTTIILLGISLLIACRSDPGSRLPLEKDSLDSLGFAGSLPRHLAIVEPVAPSRQSNQKPKTIRDQVTATFLEEVGQLEVGKNNHGPAVKKYLASVGLGEGYAWCAAFVKWVLSKNGLPASGANAWSPSWFPASRVIYQRNSEAKGNPQSGDVFGIYFSTKKRIAHVGFIHEWTEKYAVTVEGNTNDAGSREGDGVYRKKRLKRQIYAVADWITH